MAERIIHASVWRRLGKKVIKAIPFILHITSAHPVLVSAFLGAFISLEKANTIVHDVTTFKEFAKPTRVALFLRIQVTILGAIFRRGFSNNVQCEALKIILQSWRQGRVKGRVMNGWVAAQKGRGIIWQEIVDTRPHDRIERSTSHITSKI